MEMNKITSKLIKKILTKKGIFIHQTSFDGSCRACTRKFGDGYVILLKETLSEHQKHKAIMHELAHIILNHLDDDTKTVEEKEKEAEEYSKNIFFYPVN